MNMKKKCIYESPVVSNLLTIRVETSFCASVEKTFNTPHTSDDPFAEITDVDIAASDWQ